MRTALTLLALALCTAPYQASGRPARSSTPRPPRPPGARACPLRAGDTLVGSYTCAQGETALDLQVLSVQGAALRVVFAFSHPPTRVAGRYTLTGSCSNERIELVPERWIVEPPNYMMVGMSGALSSDGVYAGRISHSSCGTFTVRLRR